MYTFGFEFDAPRSSYFLLRKSKCMIFFGVNVPCPSKPPSLLALNVFRNENVESILKSLTLVFAFEQM
jgi:hypothetical protein